MPPKSCKPIRKSLTIYRVYMDEPTVDDLTTNEYIIADIDTETTSTVEATAQ